MPKEKTELQWMLERVEQQMKFLRNQKPQHILRRHPRFPRLPRYPVKLVVPTVPEKL